MIAQKNRGRRAAAAAAIAMLTLGATGCGAINEQATTFQYAASDGVVLNVGDLDIRNLMLVTKSATDEARLLGSLVNATDAAQTLDVELSTGSVSISVPAKTSVKLEETKKTLPSTGVIPGGRVETTLSVGTNSDTITIPVVDGTLEEYREYVPGGFDEHDLEHLTPEPKTAEH